MGSFAAAGILLVLFILTESWVREPLVDLSLFNDRLFAVGNFLRGVVEFATLRLFFPLGLFLQVQLGYSPLENGLLFLPLVAASLFVSPLAGSLSDRVDARWLVVPGLLALAGGIFWMSHLSPESGWGFFVAPLAVLGAGLGALYGPTTSTTPRDVPIAQSGMASGVSYTAFPLGSELGLAVAGATLQSRFTANVEDALSGTNLPPGVADGISSSVSEDGVGGQTSAEVGGAGAAQIEVLIQGAFAEAVGSALMICVALALLGAVAALFFSPRRKAKSAKGEKHEVQER